MEHFHPAAHRQDLQMWRSIRPGLPVRGRNPFIDARREMVGAQGLAAADRQTERHKEGSHRCCAKDGRHHAPPGDRRTFHGRRPHRLRPHRSVSIDPQIRHLTVAQSLASLPRSGQRASNIDDVVTGRRWIVLGPGDPKSDPEVDTPDLPELKIAVGQIQRPFRRKADAKTGRHQ
jgi:hypothetical protein